MFVQVRGFDKRIQAGSQFFQGRWRQAGDRLHQLFVGADRTGCERRLAGLGQVKLDAAAIGTATVMADLGSDSFSATLRAVP